LQGLNSARGFIRKEMGKKIRMRRLPDIHFTYDGSVEYGYRIENILKEISSADEGNDN
jgi:ribosome-binding factor A